HALTLPIERTGDRLVTGPKTGGFENCTILDGKIIQSYRIFIQGGRKSALGAPPSSGNPSIGDDNQIPSRAFLHFFARYALQVRHRRRPEGDKKKPPSPRVIPAGWAA